MMMNHVLKVRSEWKFIIILARNNGGTAALNGRYRILKTNQVHKLNAAPALLTSTAPGRPPIVGNRTILELLEEHFHFKHVDELSLTTLPSYHDRNYYFQGVPNQFLESGLPHNAQHYSFHEHDKLKRDTLQEYVLKINNPLFSSYKVLQGVNFLLKHLERKGFECTQPLTSKIGSDILQIEGEELLRYERKERSDVTEFTHEAKFPVRALTYIPGEIFADVDRKYLTPDLLYEVGKVMGSVSKELHELHVPALEDRVLEDWDLMHFPDIDSYARELDDLSKRQMVDEVLRKFNQYVVPRIPTFKRGIIHGDANSYNIILKKDPNDGDRYRMGGIIDFDNCVSSCHIFDLGILLTYAMFKAFEIEHSNPIEFVSPMLCGYVHSFPFNQEEINSLLYLIMARCCQCVVIGNYSFKKEPWNTYLLTTHEKCWKVLSVLLNIPKLEVDDIWARALEGEK